MSKRNKHRPDRSPVAPSTAKSSPIIGGSPIETAVLREGPEPTANRKALPVMLILMLGLFIYLADANMNNRAGEFDRRVYYPFTSLASVDEAHPKSPVEKIRRDGRNYYTLYCSPCHQGTGQGLAGQYPPLAGSEWVVGEGPNRVARIVLNAVAGPIEVKGTHFDSAAMPPWKPVLSDEQIAAILTYIRSEWGNKAPPVTPEQVKKIRDHEQSRETPWSAEELTKIPEKD
jgi:mono/diheme cytochrome c family protein